MSGIRHEKKTLTESLQSACNPPNKDIETKASKVKFPANKAVTIKINLPL